MRVSGNSYNRREFLQKGSFSFGAAIASTIGVGDQPLQAMAVAKPIPTLTGFVNPGNLGTTLMHEHILWFCGPQLDNPGYTPIPDNLKDESVAFAVSLLNDAARVGIDTIVDLTPYRPVNLYRRIATQTSVKIIVSSGFYRRAKIPKWMADMEDEKEMEDLMLKEVVSGIDESGVKAGILKIATEGAELTDWEKKVFRAAARVQRATGIPIATHTGGAAEQFKTLMKAGADPNRLFLSHVDVGRAGKPGELISIAKEGCYLEVDTFGQSFYTPWADLVSFLRSFCDAGLAGQLLISMDSNWHWENGKKIFEGSGPPHFDAAASARTFAYLITDAVPALLKSGFSKKEIDVFLVENPAHFFTGK